MFLHARSGTKPGLRKAEAPICQPGLARAAVRERLHDCVNLTQFPPPPSSATEWRERAIGICNGMPGVRGELQNVPVGWFSLVEFAAKEIRHLLPPGTTLNTDQLKEKCIRPVTAMSEP